ncbi:hypothetical protein [Gimesia sp.]|uniref:hypothetical protein n=1 Tax=Gimesia sp. TaxID=2024833 RepID=UPI003A8F92B9
MSQQRQIGVTVLPEYLQHEGVEAVLDNLMKRAGITAVSTSPYVMQLADEQTGVREPPADAGAGQVRLLDRPLWEGKRELWVKTSPSFVPDQSLYSGLRYQPAQADDLTHSAGHVVAELIEAAQERGLEVYFQVQAAIPPGYRVQFGGPVEEDIPRLPDGSLPRRRVANNGSLASPHIIEYQHALIRDLLNQYPDIDGLRFDWPEYPPYFLDSAFFDFSDHARQAANRLGYNFEHMQSDSQALYQKLNGGLTNYDLETWLSEDNQAANFPVWLNDHFPGAAEMLLMKAQLSKELLAGFRNTMDDCGKPGVELAPSAFPPPWSILSGMNYSLAAKYCNSVSVKLYGMHWSMMLRSYGDQMLAANPGISESLLVRALFKFLDITDWAHPTRLAEVYYPGPDQPHIAGPLAQERKILAARKLARPMPIYALAHGYGPTEDFRKRMQVATDISPDGVWINRYCYLNDDKLDIIGQCAVGCNT